MRRRRAERRFGDERGIDAVHDIVRHALRHGHGAEQLADLAKRGLDLTAEFAAVHMVAYLCRV
ncbi:hypothetical protein ACH4CE_02345 [Streptomyces gelaticus]|uniref:hypothetical protein n=1 Tax=Streptomyces gelaticus TaxID=285446 RepID=UPI00378A5937